MKPNCCDAEKIMTPEQGERYLRLTSRLAEYWETGDGFGGYYYRDFALEAEMQSAIASFCDEVNGWVEPDPIPAPLA